MPPHPTKKSHPCTTGHVLHFPNVIFLLYYVLFLNNVIFFLFEEVGNRILFYFFFEGMVQSTKYQMFWNNEAFKIT